MLDFSMGEIGLIAAVALVVLGPDKLPQVAKTAGTLMGKAQRFVAQVKNDIDKEVELSELKKIQEDAKKMASDLQDSLKNTTDQIEKQVKDVSDSVTSAGQEIKSTMDSASKDLKESWMESTSPKAELSMENIVDNLSASTIKAEETSEEWGDIADNIDSSGLEEAFDWAGNTESSVVPAELQAPAPTVRSVMVSESKVEVSEEMLQDLRRELEMLKAQISTLQTNSTKNSLPFTPHTRVNKTRISRITS